MKSVLNIIGCDNADQSVSYQISKFVEEKVLSKEFRFINITIDELFSNKVKLTSTINDLYDYENVIVYTQLYMGGFSSKLIKIFEIFAKHKRDSKRTPYFSIVINSNLQEELNAKYNISSAKVFSDYMGFKWQRGVYIGLAKSVEGKHFERLGATYDPVIKELLMFCADLVNEKQTYGVNFATPYLPKRLWINSNNMYWKRQSLKHKSLSKINFRPYMLKVKQC
ncbi:hypothetical protein SAMN02745163_02798 [Clostridium cavendishii DSM 21758]|uniref:Flavodoxin-like fold n=1 Tax=Clostridium cavendishii DSM 21758 TaxID=1121302 RepID=A0A1M6MXC7_9CLOT|nr:hypothetical protein [Clostridium cavendishii]SHJ88127.1 hypothetical protein SAMN02745163_02798 [Clostridium cavendishii DSM 21758]